jgi:5,10-methylenetetrahydromethanopterin reductase
MAQAIETNGTSFKHFGICVSTRLPSNDIIKWAVMAEEEGLDMFCVGEAFLVHKSYHYRGAVPVVSAIAQATNRIKICLGITSPHLRHTSLLAVDTAAIDEISGGRFILGLGTMTRPLLELGYNVHLARSLAGMRESIIAIRGVLSGKTFSYQAATINFDVRDKMLGFKPVRELVPIYIGASSDKMLRMTGEMADGLIITSSASISGDFIRHAINLLEEGATQAGRNLADIDIVSYPVISISRDSKKAKSSVKAVVATRMARDHFGAHLETSGIPSESIEKIKILVEAGDMEEAQKQISDDDLNNFAIAGTPDECVDGLRKLGNLGLKTICPMLYGGPNPEEAIRLFAREVVPYCQV